MKIHTLDNVRRVSVEKCLDALDHAKKGTINLEEFEVSSVWRFEWP